MRRVLLILTIAAGLSACDEADKVLDSIDDGLSNEEIVDGLKTALEVGTDTAVSILSITDGYYGDDLVKIFLPPEAKPIVDNIGKLPLGDQLLEDAVKTINRAAEDAANTAAPIFKDAIVNMSISDGLDILNGDDSSATSFLRTNTYTGLQGAFQPKISQSLDKKIVGNVSAESAYGNLVDAFNTVAVFTPGLDEIKENTLSEYTTRKALDGLFMKVADEEKAIRNDPLARVQDILEKVFGSKDK